MQEEITFLFTDIEGSTRLWEQEPLRMQGALAVHDRIARETVRRHGGAVVKMTGDGLHAAFADPVHAVQATLDLQVQLADPASTNGLALQVRCGLHAGPNESRDGDYYGTVVNRAARIMSAAHGGQALVSQAVAERIARRLPPDVRLRELGSVRLRDLAHPERLYQLLHPHFRADFPALRSLEETPNNLPHQPTSFIGRDNEIATLQELLQRARLLTLVGMGGIGKSRISLHLAAEALDDFPDGAWLVELAPLADPRLVVQALASVLGVQEEPGRPLVEAVLRFAKGRRMLVVLDNCEHVTEACGELASAMLSAAPALRIIATSREPLHIAGETTYLIPPLPVVDLRARLDPATLQQSEAVRLFVDRACAVLPDFNITEQNAPAIAAICHRLDGIPLAIELAAARVRALSPDEIAHRLGDRFRLLTRGNRSALPRQQTLRALIDWSYDLLSPAEAALFRRLAVFAGGWTLQASESLSQGASLGDDSLDLLEQLVEKSLVVHERESNRYRFLETVRQYALERLEEAGEAGDARARHGAFFRALVERARPELVGREQAAWMRRLDQERENILAAHGHALAREDCGEEPALIAMALKMYWINRGLLELGHRVLQESADRLPAGCESEMARLQLALGQLLFLMGRYGEAIERLESSLDFARRLGQARIVAAVLQPLGLSCAAEGDAGRARRYIDEAVTLARATGDKREVAAALNGLAQVHFMEGRFSEARVLFEQVLATARELGDRESTGIGLVNVVMASIGREPAECCRAMLREALAIALDLNSRRLAQSVFEVCAGVASHAGQWERVARYFGTAEALAERTGLRREPPDETFLRPLVQRAREALGQSAFGAAEQAGRQLPYAQATAEAREFLESAEAAITDS